jgi:hypothetical protein
MDTVPVLKRARSLHGMKPQESVTQNQHYNLEPVQSLDFSARFRDSRIGDWPVMTLPAIHRLNSVRFILLARGFDTCQDREAQQYDRAYRDPTWWNVQYDGAIDQPADYDQKSNNVKAK